MVNEEIPKVLKHFPRFNGYAGNFFFFLKWKIICLAFTVLTAYPKRKHGNDTKNTIKSYPKILVNIRMKRHFRILCFEFEFLTKC